MKEKEIEKFVQLYLNGKCTHRAQLVEDNEVTIFLLSICNEQHRVTVIKKTMEEMDLNELKRRVLYGFMEAIEFNVCVVGSD